MSIFSSIILPRGIATASEKRSFKKLYVQGHEHGTLSILHTIIMHLRPNERVFLESRIISLQTWDHINSKNHCMKYASAEILAASKPVCETLGMCQTSRLWWWRKQLQRNWKLCKAFDWEVCVWEWTPLLIVKVIKRRVRVMCRVRAGLWQADWR